jgi:uncharacterized protein YajQ (UPF0234 family)
MADSFSFDIVSEVDLQEIDNAVNQAMKEIGQRYDFKGSISTIELKRAEKELHIASDNDSRLKAVVDILQGRLVKRGIPLKAMDYQKAEQAFGGTVRQVVKIISGLPPEASKDIVRRIKDTKLRVQVAIQEGKVRVSGKAKDDLQAVMQMLRAATDIKVALQFVNYR